jgi:M6 family metalloprotease-like protein
VKINFLSMNFASISASKHKLPPGRRGATIMKANRGQITGLGMSWLLSLLVTIAGAKALPAGQTSMPIVNGASAREQILAMNEELESLARASTKQTQPSERARIGTLLQLRAGLLEQIIRRDPAGAIELGLPPAARENLAKQAVEAGGALESRGEWEGRLEVVVEDDFQNRRSRTLYYLSGTDGVLEVYFAAGVPPPGTSRPIHVSGMRLGQLLAASQWRSVDTLSAAACSTTGEQRVAVLLVSFPSQPLLSVVTADMFRQDYFGSGLSLDGFLRESSNGTTWATGQVFGPFALDTDAFDQPAAVRDAALRVASSSVDLRGYTRFVLVVPQEAPGFESGGFATIGCSEIPLGASGSVVASTTWLGDASLGSESYRRGMVVHEMGHNLGLWHARAADFGGEPLGPVGELPAPWDYAHDYGDSFSNMGRELGHWAAPHKLLLGWLQNGTTVQTVETSGSFVLQPYEDSTSGVKALRIRRGTGNDAWLWLENRQPLGAYDSTLPASAFTGAMVHYEDAAWRDTEAHTNLVRFAADDPRGLFFGNAPLGA